MEVKRKRLTTETINKLYQLLKLEIDKNRQIAASGSSYLTKTVSDIECDYNNIVADICFRKELKDYFGDSEGNLLLLNSETYYLVQCENLDFYPDLSIAISKINLINKEEDSFDGTEY